MDPALGGPAPVVGLSYDGLVGFDHADGTRLVPDLAAALPAPTDAGRTYVFRLRPRLRFSDGTPVRPSDVRRSFARMYALGSAGIDIFPALSEIVADDRHATVTFHLREPDPEFLYKLALPYASGLARDDEVANRRDRPVRLRVTPEPSSTTAIRTFASGRMPRSPTATPTTSCGRAG